MTTPLPPCLPRQRRVHHPAINETVQLVHEAMLACRIQPYDEAAGTGQLRYIQLTAVDEAAGGGQPAGEHGAAATRSNGGSSDAAVQLALVWNCARSDASEGRRLAAFADHLWQAGRMRFDGTRLLHSLWCGPAEGRAGAAWRRACFQHLACFFPLPPCTHLGREGMSHACCAPSKPMQGQLPA